MEKLHEWCLCRHPRLAKALRVVYAWGLVFAIFMAGCAVGSLGTWAQATLTIAQQREDYRQALAAVAAAVGKAAGTADQAAENAERAVGLAAGAAKTAKGAASKASAAAASASTAARNVEKALPLPSPDPVEVPEWLNTH